MGKGGLDLSHINHSEDNLACRGRGSHPRRAVLRGVVSTVRGARLVDQPDGLRPDLWRKRRQRAVPEGCVRLVPTVGCTNRHSLVDGPPGQIRTGRLEKTVPLIQLGARSVWQWPFHVQLGWTEFGSRAGPV